jgi:hypothetical protein
MWSDAAEKAKYEAWADQRVHFGAVGGVGLWTYPDTSDSMIRLEEVGKWMSESLSSET